MKLRFTEHRSSLGVVHEKDRLTSDQNMHMLLNPVSKATACNCKQSNSLQLTYNKTLKQSKSLQLTNNKGKTASFVGWVGGETSRQSRQYLLQVKPLTQNGTLMGASSNLTSKGQTGKACMNQPTWGLAMREQDNPICACTQFLLKRLCADHKCVTNTWQNTYQQW